VASVGPKLVTPPPAHDLLLTTPGTGSAATLPATLDVRVDEGSPAIRVSMRNERYATRLPRIFLWDHAAQSVRELSIELPDDWDQLEDGALLAIPELENARIDTSLRAPDGYEYRGVDSYEGFMFGLFGGSRRRNAVTIAKDGAIVSVDVPGLEPYGYGNIQFLGWVVGPQ